MIRALAISLLSLCIFVGCERPRTQAELECDVLRATFQYFYDHDAATPPAPRPKVIFVGIAKDFEPTNLPLMEVLYADASPEWQSALTSTGIPTRPVSSAVYTPTSPGPSLYQDPTTGEPALVFSIDRITFPSPDRAVVECAAAVGPSSGGSRTYQLIREKRVWHVTASEITTVF